MCFRYIEIRMGQVEEIGNAQPTPIPGPKIFPARSFSGNVLGMVLGT